MAAEYTLSYTGAEINARLGQVALNKTKIEDLEVDVSSLENSINNKANKSEIPDVSDFITTEDAQSYADTAANNAVTTLKNELLNGAGAAYDTLKELGELIDENATALDALEVVATNKADKSELDNKQDKDFVVIVNELNIADKTWTEVYEAREAGRRIILDNFGLRYDYIGEGYDYSIFHRITKDGIYEAHLYDWHQTVEFTNDPFVDLDGYYTQTETDELLATKQPVGNYLTSYTETDPTVPSWAKASSKPSYSKSEVGLGNVDNIKQYSANNPPPYPVTSVNSKTGAVTLDASAVGADKSGTASSAVSAHNTKNDAHNDIRLLITALTNRLDALANSDDDTLDQMAELVAYIKANRDLITQVTNSKISVTDIVNNLTTNVTNKPLSAAQGVALKALVDAITVPTKVSQLVNDAGYLKSYTETDPTVPSWAKAAEKPTYTSTEINCDFSSEPVEYLMTGPLYLNLGILDRQIFNANRLLSSKADLSEGVIFIEGSGTTDSTAKTSTWVGTSDKITEYYDGLAIRYKIGVEGQSTVTLNVNGLGTKTIYRFSTTKLTTQFPVGSIITLIYHADLNDGCWVTNDYDANTNTYQRLYKTTGNVEYPITTRYNTTTGSSYYAEYGRYSESVTLNPSTNTITATAFKGKLTGNADTATKATQDGSGNVITSTYAKKADAETWTFTLEDGSTVTKKVVLG